MYFHTLFHPHIYQKNTNNIPQTPLPNSVEFPRTQPTPQSQLLRIKKQKKQKKNLSLSVNCMGHFMCLAEVT